MTALNSQRLAAATALAISLLFAPHVHAEAISGAIYTSVADSSTVNANLYENKADVYLNGGPPLNAPCTSGGLDDADYFFQVTSPDGKKLLSQDKVFERKFRVSGGVITQYLGTTHGVGTGNCPGAISIQLVPYADTPNNGGVYKVWVTRVSDYLRYCPVAARGKKDCGLAGFVPGNTKTDNFRVRNTGGTSTRTGNLIVSKYYDANANGAWDAGELPLADWPMTVTPNVTPATQPTGQMGQAFWTELKPGDYVVQEGEPTEPSHWFNSDPGPNPVTLDGDLVLTPVRQNVRVDGGVTAEIDFGNFCTAPSGGHTKGFWHNQNGLAAMMDGGTAEPELSALRGEPLWDADGNPFDPTTHAQLADWLTFESSAANMANMLSAQYAAMWLNLEYGFVDGSDYYGSAGKTIDEIMSAARAALVADSYTPDGDANRASQGQLKDWIDALNNGAYVIPSVPCAYSFP